MTFHGEPRADEETMHHAHESPWVMLIPLFVLAIGAAFVGYLAERLLCRRRARRVLEELDPGAAAVRFARRCRRCPVARSTTCR